MPAVYRLSLHTLHKMSIKFELKLNSVGDIQTNSCVRNGERYKNVLCSDKFCMCTFKVVM